MKHQSSHGRRRASAVAFRLSRFSPAYRQRLLDGLKDLHEYTLGVHGCTLDAVCKKPAFADLVLGEYVICRFNEKKSGSLSRVKYALLGCQHLFPTLRSKIATCWANLKTWKKTAHVTTETTHSWTDLGHVFRSSQSPWHHRKQQDSTWLVECFCRVGWDWVCLCP